MKKQCCSIIFFFITLNVCAQQKSSVSFGIKTGIAFSNNDIAFIDTANTFSSSGKTGILLGVFLNKPIGRQFIFQPAILYVRKGYKVGSYSSIYKNPIPYLEIPLNILYTLPSKNFKYYIGAGVSPAIKLNNYVFGDDIKDVDVGLNIIGGFMIPIGFSFNLGYTKGLQNVSKNNLYISKIQNSYFSVTVGYEF